VRGSIAVGSSDTVIGLLLRTWSRAWRGAIVLATLPWLPGLVAASCTRHELAAAPAMTPRAELHYAWAREHLEAPFHGYGVLDDMGVHAFDAILLSHLAIGLANVAVLDPARVAELRPLAREVVRRAASAEVSPTGVPAERARIGDHNLHASHLLLILGVAHRLGATEREHDALATRLARHLRERSLASADFHARSYPGSARWPADQAVTLAALDLHDREHGTTLAPRPIAGWLAWLARHRTSGLPWSTTGSLAYARIPRGCALSWMTSYMAQFAPDEGARLYAAYRAQHAISWLGWRGFREWQPGHHGGSDVDAGPVLFGWGTAATGIGLGAARLYGDGAQHAGIARIADTVGMRVPGTARYLLAPTLGQAILFAGETATFWHARPALPPRTESEWPLGPLALLLALLALDAWLLRGLARVGRPREQRSTRSAPR
jgi:hypothetical protein